MGSFETNGDYYRINVFATEKVIHEKNGLDKANDEIKEYIFNCAKQMAAFLQSDHNETGVLRTPSRRISKRKISSTAGKKTHTAVKVRDVSVATPRRFSKRSKRSTLKLDTTVELMEVNEVPQSVATVVTHAVHEIHESSVVIEETINANHLVQDMDIVTENKSIEEKIEIIKDINVNEILIFDNKVITASELMSELSIREDEKKEEKKSYESENEWLTDDEDCPPKAEKEEFYDAVDNKTNLKTVSNNSLVSRTLLNSSAKEKHKKSLYFTPQTNSRSTRAQTRMLSRIADSSQKTPQTTSRCSRIKDSNVTSSGETTSSRLVGTSSNRSIRSHSRIQKRTDTKSLTNSAMKRRQEAENERRAKLLASQEKEKRAIEKRRILLEEKVNEKKIKSQEKVNRVAEVRERQKQLETERLKKELEKREELDRKRMEERKEQIRKRQEENNKRVQEMERRKQIKELQDLEEQKRRQEELERKQEQERERLREQEKMAAIIQHHNSSLQHKAVANSFIKKQESVTNLMPKVMVTKMSASETAQHLNNTYKVSKKKSEELTESRVEGNSTYVMNKEANEVSSYDMTPPPKTRDYDNYDISEIQSDDDTDDDTQPRKRIPSWARGHHFVEILHKQYNKSQRAVFKEVKGVFGTGEELLKRFQVEFELMIPNKPLHPRYAQRTSSAVWDETLYRFDESLLNQSLRK